MAKPVGERWVFRNSARGLLVGGTVGHIVEAWKIFRREPRLWRYAWGPIGVALLVVLALAFGGLSVLNHWVSSRFSGGGSDTSDGIRLAADLAYLVLMYFVATAVFLALAALFGSFFWDRLTGDVERIVTGNENQVRIGCFTSIADSIGRIIFTVVMALVAIGCGAAVPVVGGILVAGIIALFDFTSNAFLRRGIGLGGQFGWVFRLPQWFSFVCVAGLLTLVPLVNVLALPVLVAAATIMVVRGVPPAPVLPPQ